jgi:WD40 repeat protein
MDGQEARLTALEFSPDGRVLATGSADGTVLLWDVDTQRSIGSPLEIEREAYVSANFSRDGSHLFAVPHTGRGVRWDMRPESWKRHACVVAGRELTEREWRDALPERPFQSVCRVRAARQRHGAQRGRRSTSSRPWDVSSPPSGTL